MRFLHRLRLTIPTKGIIEDETALPVLVLKGMVKTSGHLLALHDLANDGWQGKEGEENGDDRVGIPKSPSTIPKVLVGGKQQGLTKKDHRGVDGDNAQTDHDQCGYGELAILVVHVFLFKVCLRCQASADRERQTAYQFQEELQGASFSIFLANVLDPHDDVG